MKIRSSSYFFIAIIVVLLVSIGLSLRMEYFQSKLLPLMIGSIVLVLSSIGLGRDIRAKREPEATVTGGEVGRSEEAKGELGAYLRVGAWVAGFVLAIYLLGFIMALPLFILSYMKSHGAGWFVAIVFAIITTAIVYGVFEFALRVELYRGLIFSLL